MTIFNYLYADLPKLASLQSQLTGKPVNPNGGVDLVGFEMELAAQGHLLDLTRENPSRSLRDTALRQKLGQTLCLKVKGRAVLEDYARLRRLLEAQPQTALFANQSVLGSLRGSDDFQQLEMMAAALSDQLKEEVNRDARAQLQDRLRELKLEMDAALAQATVVLTPEPMALEGLRTWIDTFLADTISLRIYLAASAPDEQVLGPLKREHFTDGQLETWHFSHGPRPTEPITLLGIVTGLPVQGVDGFEPSLEFEAESLSNVQQLEKNTRQTLAQISTLAEHSRQGRFPRVMVQPLLVYRSFVPNVPGR